MSRTTWFSGSGEVYHVGSTCAWITPLGPLPPLFEAALAKEQERAERIEGASAERRGRIHVDLAGLKMRYQWVADLPESDLEPRKI